jgi:aryl-alcohol dehydrogenase-like predicted oxidoreductase
MRPPVSSDRKPAGGVAQPLIPGRATPDGTRAFASRSGDTFAPDFYRLAAGLTTSSIGMGTYLGECDDAEDARYVASLEGGIERGLNLLDTAINYRCQRSERAVGLALRDALSRNGTSREEVIVCTKGGYVPLEGQPPESREEYSEYLETEYFKPGIMSRSDLVAGGHCLTAAFLANQIDRSRANIGVECIDIFYLHNPEQQLDTLDRPQFLLALEKAFAELESQVARGHIATYGCATWSGFRTFAASRNHLSLTELIGVARKVAGGEHHFSVVQLPVNLAMTEAIRAPTQSDNGRNVALLDLAQELGVSVVASASLMQAQLTTNLPAPVKAMFPLLKTDAQRAIAFVRSLPVASALVGMKQLDHLDENLVAGAVTIRS